jgi:hypothetical protein
MKMRTHSIEEALEEPLESVDQRIDAVLLEVDLQFWKKL